MIPILKALTYSHSFSIKSERKSKSLLFAKGQIEELRARSILDDYESEWSQTNGVLGGGYYYNIYADSDSVLRTVTVETGYDLDQDLHLDSGEILIELRTLIAKQQ